MTPDKLERTIEFILEHQARAAVHMEEAMAQSVELRKAVLTLKEIAQIQSLRLDGQDERLKRQDEHFKRQDEHFRALLTNVDQGRKEVLSTLAEILRRLVERQ